MNKTGIEWCTYTWNPIVGCSPVSAGCLHCYAAAISKRFHLPWGKAHFMPDRLGQPAKVKKPSRVFVCSMSDIGHESVEPQWRTHIASAMLAAPWHTYIVLTKRPGQWLRTLPPACWVGVTIENQARSVRWNQLLAWAWPGAPVKFVSVEPMLTQVSFDGWLAPRDLPDWVIAGPETGPGARPCESWWIQHLQSECMEEGIPFFDKRNGAMILREWPKGES